MSPPVSEERHICKTCGKIMPPDECFAHAERTGHHEFRPYFDEDSTEDKERVLL